MSVFLGIDIGTSATKTLAIDERGKILAEATSGYPLNSPRPLWSEQNPEDWWRATRKTIRSVTNQGAFSGSDVKVIGLTGQMHGAVFLDKNNEVIRPAILWNDQRTTEECASIERQCGGREQLIELVANPAITGFTLPKILWLRAHEPANYARTRRILLPKDYIRYRLTGAFATDVSDASGILLLDVRNRTWSNHLLSIVDVDRELLPECFESPEVTGNISESMAKELGLSAHCKVVAGAGDCPAAAVGTGIVSSGVLSTSIGTSSVMMVHSDDYKIDPAGRVHTVCHAVPGKWMIMGVNLCGGGCLQWFRNQLCASEHANFNSGDFYDALAREASNVTPGSESLFFLPYLSGERTPHYDADVRACFIGLSLAHTRGHMVRAIMEGVAYNMNQSLEIIRSLDIPVDEIRASGGGSRSPVWREIQGAVFGQPVCTLNAEQGPAYGAALLAAVGHGAFHSVEEACEATISVVQRSAFDQARHAFYRKGFSIFQRLYVELKDTFREMSSLGTVAEATPEVPTAR